MPLDLKKLKSAVLIEGSDKVEAKLAEILKQKGGESTGFKGHTILVPRKDSPTIIAKASAFELKEAEIKASPELAAPGAQELQQLARARGRKWKAGLETRAIPYWASDERVDGHGDIVKQNWLFDEFEKNSPMPYSHEWHNVPIGNILSWRTLNRAEGDYVGQALWLLGLFATLEESARADEVFRLAEAGVLRGGSVGFYSTKLIDITDEAERAKLGLGRWGLILDQNHLLEFSPTTLGANAGAYTILSRAKARGLLKATDFGVIRELARVKLLREKREDVKERWEDIDSTYLAFAKMLYADHEFKTHDDVEQPFETDEERRLKNVPLPSQKTGTSEERLSAIETKLEQLEASQREAALSNTQILTDIRSLLEKAASAAPAPEPEAGGTTRGEEASKGGDSSDPVTGLTRRILDSLEGVPAA